MSVTVSIYDVICSELEKEGYNEFVDKDGQLTFFNDDYSFIRKIMSYDDEVKEIVDRLFFRGISLKNPNSDNTFKKAFINKFLNRHIKHQTTDIFASILGYKMISNLDYINYLYDELDEFITGDSVNETDSSGNDINDNRFLSTSLPQSEVNLNVDNTILDYGDTNTITRTKGNRSNTSTTKSSQKNLDNLLKTKGLIEEFFIQIDRDCFLQIW